jgi:hypothetical protein
MRSKYATVKSDHVTVADVATNCSKASAQCSGILGMLRNLPKQHLPRYGLLQ